ncbi:helix-turn-helix domain-containing protein [Latilactobacillus sakei]|uniref:helix-turn-helix domain-containing protein n=1 Tax=Latilactobacillus sakei TaxID=1599 RepID=UPI003F538CF5
MIYDEIKQAARKKGISVYRIERDLKISNGTLSKWNNASPSAIVLKKVADYLQVDINVLLSDEQVTH